MITEMKKLTLFVSENHKEAALDKLQELGVVHIKNINPPVTETVSDLESRVNDIESSLNLLKQYKKEKHAEKELEVENAAEIVDNVLELNRKKEVLQEELQEINNTLTWYENWGAVGREKIQELQQEGIYIKLYAVQKARVAELKDEHMAFVVGEGKGEAYVSLITEDPEESLDVKEETVPEKSLQQAQARKKEIQDKLKEIEENLTELVPAQQAIQNYRDELTVDLDYARAEAGMASEESISYLQGFCPTEETDKIEKAAEEEGWGFIFETPEDPNEVPTKLSESTSKELVDPIYDFMGTLPGYDELDISASFLIFFTIFVAMIVGDAGYGLIYLGLTYLASKKMSDGNEKTFKLFYILSGATIVWGVLTGTYFGIESIQSLKIVDLLIIDKINSFAQGNQDFLMFITFVIGAAQMILGHGIQAVNELKEKKYPQVISQLGWISVVFAMFFVAEKIVLGGEVLQGLIGMSTLGYIVAAGAIVVLLFENYEPGNLLGGIGETVSSLPMDIIDAFSDVISYVRLFAVGLATVAIETSFNTMAVGEGIDSVAGAIIAVVILLLGHSLNMILAVMSVIVHGIRLNMLEYSNHVGMTWSGRPYKPFSKKKNDNPEENKDN